MAQDTATIPTVETTPVVETSTIVETAPAVEAPVNPTLELTGKDVYTISFVEAGIPYKKGKRNENGKTFTRYSRNNIAFSVPTEHPFNQDFATGQVKSVVLTLGSSKIERINDEGESSMVTTPTIQFASYINKTQWSTVRDEELEDAKADFAIARFKKLKGENVSAEFLSALMNVSA